jgi:penicillin-binding protein 2
MHRAVLMGTARASKIQGIDMCGKTGTAQNPHGDDHAVFFAFAPRENPKIAIAVFVENAGYGGTWAAPIASMLVEKYINDTITLPKYIQDRIYNGNLLPKTKKEEVKPSTVENRQASTTTVRNSNLYVHHSQMRREHE